MMVPHTFGQEALKRIITMGKTARDIVQAKRGSAGT